MLDEIADILVVDDEPDLEVLVRQRFRRRIRKGEVRFHFAQDGVQALEALDRHPEVELIMTDINMPRMDGLTLLAALKEARPRVRAVVVSAYGDMRNIRTAMNQGAFDFITKPIDFEDLEVTIDKTLQHLKVMRDALDQRNELLALHEELRVARNMQMSILPTRFPTSDGSEVHAVMTPAREVGGDFYDVFRLPDDRLGVVMADVSGKGVPAALFMMVSRTLLKGHAIGAASPGEVLTLMNRHLVEENESAMFVTCLFGILDADGGSFTYANGGHCSPYLVRPGAEPKPLASTSGVAIGVAPGCEYAEETVVLEPGDGIFCYTDGIPEAEGADDELFGEARLEAVLQESAGKSPEAINAAVVEAVAEFTRDVAQSDDITCLTVSRLTDPRS